MRSNNPLHDNPYNANDSQMQATAEGIGVPEKCSPWQLLAMPIGVGLLLAMVVTAVRLFQEVDMKSIYLGLDGMRTPIAACLISLLALGVGIWWLRPRLKTLCLTTGLLLIVAIMLFNTVRVESFYGNMVPRLTWRWNPTAEERVKTYFTSTAGMNSTAGSDSLFDATEHDFPQFLGPHRDARISGVQLASDWQQHPPQPLWRHPVGLGWSSFAIVGQVAIDLEQRGERECVVCYHARSGEELWCHGETLRFEDEHGDGPRSTPTIYGNRVLSMGACGLLTCVDLRSGELVWKAQALPSADSKNLLWGMSGSPLVINNQVIVTPGGGHDTAVVAFSLENGQELWRGGDDPAAYASPICARICGTEQLLSFNGAGLRGFSMEGTPLWLAPWLTQGESQRVNVAQPVVLTPRQSTDSSTRVLISSGYGNGTALIEITQIEGQWRADEVWSSKQLKAKMSNFVVHDGFVYGLDNGILTCLDLETGQRQWKHGRYGHGQMLLVGDKLLIQAESGEVVIVAVTPDSHQELSRFTALNDKTWNNLALAGNLLIVRNDRDAAAFELPCCNHRPQAAYAIADR